MTFLTEHSHLKSSNEVTSNMNSTEFPEQSFNFLEIKILWEHLLGFPIEDIVKSPEFRDEGISLLIKESKQKVPESKEKDQLLSYLNFLADCNEKFISLSGLPGMDYAEMDSHINNDFAEPPEQNYNFLEVENLWERLLGFPIEDIVKSPEFRDEGISLLIKESKQKVPEGEEKDQLLSYLNFLADCNQKFISLLSSPNLDYPEQDSSEKTSESIRHSGHFIDQKLKYDYPLQSQLTIFDSIQSDTRAKIEKYEYEITSVGVRLTPAEDKLLNSLQKLLHEKSQNQLVNNPDYYKGNMPVASVNFGNEKRDSPRLRIKPAELYKAYLDRDRYSREEIKYIRETLIGLSAKKFLLKFDRKRQVIKDGKAQILTDRIEEFKSLIQVIKYTEGMSEQELKKANSGDDSIFESRGELIIGFNPILVDQINSKYVEYPSDINKRMILAAGGHRFVTEAMNLLRDYMLRELSSKRIRVEINKDKLPHILKLHKLIETRQKKRAEKKTEDAIQAIKNLGLISSSEIVKGSQGQEKYLFTLNPNFK